MSIMIQRAFEECLIVHLSIITELHSIIFLTPNYITLITRLSIKYHLTKTLRPNTYMNVHSLNEI